MMVRSRIGAAAAAVGVVGACLVAAGVAAAQPCAPEWQAGLGPPGAANANGCYTCTDAPVYAAIVYDDDGPGPHGSSLYIGGRFSYAGGTRVSNIARWTGTGWVPVGPVQGMPPGGIYPDTVRQLLAISDGSVSFPRLYLIGSFTGGDSMVRRLTLDGTQWELVNNANIVGTVPYGAAVFDDGSGSGAQLYVGGLNSFFSGSSLGTVAKFNGTSWSSAGFTNGSVYCLAALDPDGEGPEPRSLFAGGAQGVFRLAPGGGSWSRVGGAAGALVGTGITSLAVFDEDGDIPNPPRLFAAGVFSSIGPVTAANIARWNGTAWSAVGQGMGMTASFPETVMRVLDDGSGPALHVGGVLSQEVARVGLAKWTGSAWADSAFGPVGSLGQPTSLGVHALEPLDATLGGGVLVAGRFSMLGNVITGNVAAHDGTVARSLGRGLPVDGRTVAVYRDGLSERGTLYATMMGALPKLLRERGFGWEIAAPATGGPINVLRSVAFPGDAQPRLIAGGSFNTFNGQPLVGIAQQTGGAGGTWSAPGGGLGGASVQTVEVMTLPGSSAPVLVAGGFFDVAAVPGLRNIGVFDGSSWSPLGTGITGISVAVPWVSALALFDDGTGAGPRLFAAGTFDSAGGAPAHNIAAWNGTSWSPVGTGFPSGTLSSWVYALAVHDEDGTGPAPARLYAGGYFEVPPGGGARHIARWTGTQWEWPSADWPGNTVYTLTSHDPDGPGGPAPPLLVAGGSFTSVGSVQARGLAAWNGSSWQVVDGGLAGLGFSPSVYSVVSMPPTSAGPARLHIAGRFVSAGPRPAYGVALLAGCPACPADFDASGAVNPSDVAAFVGVWFAALTGGRIEGDFDGNGSVAPADVAAFVGVWFAALNNGC